MTIRKKIFLLAGILLALFGVVVGVLAVIQKLDSDEINNIAEYELPLTRLVAEIDVDTDRYELGILRALRLDPLTPPELAAAIAAKKEVGDELRADVDTATALLANGELTMAALAEGRREDARTASLGFAKFAQAFGPDLSEIRRNLASLTDRATRAVLARQRLNTYLSFGLFVAACGIGLGISAVGSARVVGGLRQLVVCTRAIEAGTDSEPLSVRTRDEVGELALSFNRMVEELPTRERIKR